MGEISCLGLTAFKNEFDEDEDYRKKGGEKETKK